LKLFKDKLFGGEGARFFEKVSVVEGKEGREVVFESADAGSIPSGECFGIDWRELVYFVRMTVGDAGDCVSNGAEEGD
jgi:hypothetical protein